MARNAEQILRETLGALVIQNATLQAEKEQLLELLKLKTETKDGTETDTGDTGSKAGPIAGN